MCVVRIRLGKTGSKGNPHFMLVVVDSKKSRDGMFIEKLGHYHQKVEGNGRVVFNQERVLYWISVGAQPSDAVVKLCSDLCGKLLLFKRSFVSSKYKGVSKKEVKELKKKEEEEKKSALNKKTSS